MKIGLAQEIITPPVGVRLAGYMNERPNVGAYDELFVKTILFERDGVTCGFMAYDLCCFSPGFAKALHEGITERFGKELSRNLIIGATHTHTGPELRRYLDDEITQYALKQILDASLRSIERALLNLQPGELETGSIYNNPLGFVRRYWMKNGTIVTNPGWGNPEIDKPESDFDRTIGLMKVIQHGRTAAIICNIANHGDTVGGSIVSADWYGYLVRHIQLQLGQGIPVLILDDASGDINHFDFRQKINQTSIKEAERIGKGYADIIVPALNDLKPLPDGKLEIRNVQVTIPHRKISDAELAEAEHTLLTVPDIPKEGDFESQDLANKVPAALRYFAQRTIDCRNLSADSSSTEIRAICFGDNLAAVALPGEPFNGIARAIRENSRFGQVLVVTLIATDFDKYIPMPECFERGGYEVMPDIDSPAPEAATRMIEAALEALK